MGGRLRLRLAVTVVQKSAVEGRCPAAFTVCAISRKPVFYHPIVELPDAEIRDTGLTVSLAKIEVALALYRDRKVSLGHGARIAQLVIPSWNQ
jgi:hypothetical protein